MATNDLITKANAILAQTKAQGTKKFAGSKYDTAKPITTDQLQPSQPFNLKLPAPQVPSSGLESSITGSVNAYKAQGEQERAMREQSQSDTKGALDRSINEIMGLNTDIANVDNTVDRTAEDTARKEADRYTSEIEAEQLANRRKIESLQKNNPNGLFGGALEQEVNRIDRDSLSKQADLAILQNSALRNYSTAKDIADREVQNKLEPLKVKLENLKFFYQENKELFNKEDERLYNEKIKSEERAYEKEETLQKTIQEIKLEAAKNGASASTLGKLSTAKTFDEALQMAGSSLATAQTDVVKLDNGNTVVVDKRTGRVISNLGGGEAPTTVAREVNGQPVTGYTLVAGDDPYFIAQQLGTDVATLKSLNPNITDWNNIQPGATINVPQAKEAGFIQLLQGSEGGKALTDTTIQKLDKGQTVLAQLGVLQANVDGVKTGPIAGAFKSANPWDTQGQTIKAQLNAIVPNLARGIYGEVGVLTDNDIKTYSQTIPNLKSTEEIRNAVLYITLDMIGKSIENTLKVNAAAGRDVSGFTDIYTEMQNTKNSILSSIPSAQVPQAFQSPNADPFLNQFAPASINSNISNSSFFNQY